MKAKWASVLAALVCLVGSMLACNLPAPTPSPTLSIAESPEPSVAPSDGTASPESTPTAAVDPTLEPTVDRLLVAYTKSRAIWIVEGESAPRQLTNGSADYSPQFSPDGQWILFQREVPSGEDGLSQNELWIIRVDGTEERRLLGANDLPRETGVGTDEDAVVTTARVPYQIAWLPDGTSIVFNTRLLIEHGLIIMDDLWLAEVGSGALTQLLSEGEGGKFVFSPDGSRLVVTTPTSVSVMNADGTNRRALVAFEPVDTASEYAYYPMPVWLPGGSLAFVAVSSPEPFGLDVPTADIWRLSLSGDALRLATLRGYFLFVSMDGSMWSADRARIAYTVPTGEEPSTEHALIVSNVDGSGDTTYATGDIQFLRWADEGDRFLFRDTESGEVFIGEIGRPSYPLVAASETERIVSIAWSGEDTIVYSLAQEGRFPIWLKRLGDAAPHTVDSAVGTPPDLAVYP